MKFITDLTKCLLLLTSFTMICCEDESLNADLPMFEPRLVLHSFISPSDTLIYAHISSTRALFGIVPDYPKNLPAKVFLDDGDYRIAFGSVDTSGICSLKYTVEPGKTYRIKAECPGYPEVTGTCTIPLNDRIVIETDTFTTQMLIYDYVQSFLNLKVKLKDISGSDNYFSLYGYLNTTTDYGTQKSVVLFNFSNEMPGSQIITDLLPKNRGLTYNSRIFYLPEDTAILSMNIKITALNIDDKYFRFDLSQRRYTGGEEFFTEFSPVYTNIENGNGIFCSYVKYEKTIILK